MLMKIELVKRVADHDNTMIDGLVELKGSMNLRKQSLKPTRLNLKLTKLPLKNKRLITLSRRKSLTTFMQKVRLLSTSLRKIRRLMKPIRSR